MIYSGSGFDLTYSPLPLFFFIFHCWCWSLLILFWYSWRYYRCFNSSVGRAQGWKLWGRWFESILKHALEFTLLLDMVFIYKIDIPLLDNVSYFVAKPEVVTYVVERSPTKQNLRNIQPGISYFLWLIPYRMSSIDINSGAVQSIGYLIFPQITITW